MKLQRSAQDMRAGAIGCGVSAAAVLAAAVAARRAERRRLRRPVRDVMAREVVGVAPGASVAHAAERLAAGEVGALAVCDDDHRLLGVLTDRDIVVRVVAQGDEAADVTVVDCLTGEPVWVGPDTSLGEALDRMGGHAVRRLPVVEDGRVIAMVSERDLVVGAPGPRSTRAMHRIAAAPADRRSAAWLFRRGHGGEHGPAVHDRRRRAGEGVLEGYARDAMRERDATIG